MRRHLASRSPEVDAMARRPPMRAARWCLLAWWALLAALAGSACARGGRAPGGAARQRPNILLITIESLRADHLSCYGYGQRTSPSLDALAREGILFENAYAVTSWTLPSHASIFTGLYPSAHRVVSVSSSNRLGDSYTTLAELLAGAGYQTAGFISGPLLQRPYNLHQGFQTYDASASNPRGSKAAHGDVTNPDMERLLTRYLRHERSRDRPFFLFAYLWDPHYDYIPPPPYDRAFVPAGAVPIDVRGYETKGIVTPSVSRGQLAYVVSQYDGEILWTDTLLGRLWDLLREVDLWDATAILVTSDHGEEFFEHGRKGHKNNLYEESVHVPLILKPPGPGGGPRRDARIASHVDLYPTVLELAGVAAPGPHHGRSLLRPAVALPIYFELRSEWVWLVRATGKKQFVPDVWLAVRDGDYKLILERNEDRRELYDLAQDPLEKRPLDRARRASLDETLGREIESHLEAMRRDARRWRRAAPARLTPEQEERLRSLGYVGPEPPPR